MSKAGVLGVHRLPVHMAPTGRCRAYPRKNVPFFASFKTAGSVVDPPPDRVIPHSASEYEAAHPTAQSTLPTHVGARCPTRPHPREGRGMGNVYSGVVRASLYPDFTRAGSLGCLCQGCA
ncbi:hypothetical protein GCM10010254_35910 [Streptomyces chromofuscus]|nr:hypothetical protein GCM10010254_35910 [Streptomyces chromofuscus]